MIFFGLWLVQGVDGAPRRWAVLPSNYDTLTRISLPFVFILAAAQALFFWNVMQTLRGKGGVATFDERGIPEPSKVRKESSVHSIEAGVMIGALALAFIFAVGGYLVGRGRSRGVRKLIVRQLPHARGSGGDREHRALARREAALCRAGDRPGHERPQRDACVPAAR